MRKFIVLIAAHTFYLVTVSAQNKYDVKLIPAELLPHANVVKRMEEIKVDIKDAGRAILYSKYVLTIMNSAGDEAAGFAEQYDQLVNIQSIDGTLYDAAGKKLKSLKKSDVKDVSGTSESSLAEDNRLKLHNFNCSTYPYTVEYESAIGLKGIFYFPRWLPIADENYAVENSKLIVQCPLGYTLRYKTFNINKEPQITTVKQSQFYEWAVEKLPAIEAENYEPEWYQITPTVFLAPSDFEIQHYTGNMTDWKGFGKFIYTLNEGRDKLPDNIKQQVHALTDNVPTFKEKIKILYQYLQKNTRYISIQLGIGGWQTFDAAYVATKGYGDCKALSNYMYSLLKEAGIKSYYTLIKAGEKSNAILSDFPSNQFNHIIVCVPQPTDTVWLECTSQTLPAGYLSGFTSNRDALLVDESGGKLVHTPVYKKTDNLQIRKITAKVNEEGQLSASIKTTYKAQQQDDLHGMLNAISKERVAEILKAQLNLPSYDITSFDYSDEKGTLPAINEMLELTANNYCATSGKRLFVTPNILNKSSSKITNAATRKFDIKLPYGFIDIDSVEISIPAGYKPESVPGNVSIGSKFGTYNAMVKISGGKIMYVRNLQRNSGRYPAADAVELAGFFSQIYTADRAKLVFVKEESK
jgi:transglutaminase-like putative cysteine protease